MKVMKFGGTSVGSVESILRVKRIVEAQQEPVIVVVSALGGITDKLIQTSRMAASGDAAYENEFREIVSRHVEMVKRVFAEFDAQMTVQRQVGELLPHQGPVAEDVGHHCQLWRTPVLAHRRPADRRAVV